MPDAGILQSPDIQAPRQGAVWPHRPSHWRPRHFHGEVEFNLVLGGRGQMYVAGQLIDVTAGTLVWMPTGQSHELVDASSDYQMWVVALGRPLAERASAGGRGLGGLLPVVRLGVDQLHRASEPLATLADGQLAQDSYDATLLRVTEGLFNLTRASPAVARPPPLAKLTRCLAEIECDPSLSEVEVARRVGLSAERLSRVARARLAIPLVEYRRRQRLQRFIELVDRGWSLTRAAFGAGYGSYSQVHRDFLREFGISPRPYFSELREQRTQTLSDRAAKCGSRQRSEEAGRYLEIPGNGTQGFSERAGQRGVGNGLPGRA